MCKHVVYTTFVSFHISIVFWHINIVYRRKIKNRKKEEKSVSRTFTMIHQVIPKICNKDAANWACFTFNRITFWLHEDKWRWDNIFSNKKITILLRYWEHFCVMLSLKEFMCRVYVPMAALITSWWTINIRTREWYSFMDIFVIFWRVGDTESKILLDRTWTWVSFDVSKKVTGIVVKLKKTDDGTEWPLERTELTSKMKWMLQHWVLRNKILLWLMDRCMLNIIKLWILQGRWQGRWPRKREILKNGISKSIFI